MHLSVWPHFRDLKKYLFKFDVFFHKEKEHKISFVIIVLVVSESFEDAVFFLEHPVNVFVS